MLAGREEQKTGIKYSAQEMQVLFGYGNNMPIGWLMYRYYHCITLPANKQHFSLL
jgi:hypothetical protein